MRKRWFITGASRGFGKEFAAAALRRGDYVAATARDITTLDDLREQYADAVLPVPLDVTDRDAVLAAVDRATEAFGGIDVAVNNAGYGLFGTIEEITAEQLRDQLEVNVIGVLHVTQAVLPAMRAAGSGHIVQISSIGGIAAFPNLGGYHASKWALEAMSESLAQEVAPFGIRVTLIEPGSYDTDWGGSSAVHAAALPQYETLHAAMSQAVANASASDPAKAAEALLRVVDSPEPPLRVLFGAAPAAIAAQVYRQRLETWDAWKGLSGDAE